MVGSAIGRLLGSTGASVRPTAGPSARDFKMVASGEVIVSNLTIVTRLVLGRLIFVCSWHKKVQRQPVHTSSNGAEAARDLAGSVHTAHKYKVCWAGNLGTTTQQLVDARNKKDSRYDNVCVLSREGSGQKRPLSNRHAIEQDVILSGSLQEARAPPSEQQYTDNIRLSGSLPPSGPHVDNSPTSLRPRYLCFVKDFEQGIYETVKVSDYLEQHGDDVDLEFVFVSYTRLQFRVATEEELNKHDYPDEAIRDANKEVARQDREILAKWGMDAAKRVGKRAFWLDFECVRNDDGIARSTSSSQDVYRICDIVRAAHSMIIAIGPPANDKVASILAGSEPPEYRRENVTPWLRQWGSRLWTLPELLLCPAEYRIRLYVLGYPAEPKELAKRNFAERAWDDAEAVKELVDHFEGSAILTDLRLIEAALACFSRRQTDQFNKGDIAYATMGLFPNRHRPPVNKEDSGFQAFAKLSIANDSGAFLSRLISLSPPDGAPWHQVEDTWGARLSEIFPSVSISGVVGADTVMLDKVYGATIHWDNLEPEPYFDRGFGMRYLVFVGFSYGACFSVPMAFSLFTGIANIVLSDFMRLSIWQVYIIARSGGLFHGTAVLLSILHGVLKGCLAVTLVKYMISWYPIKELPLRFLFWNVAFAGLISLLGSLPEITFHNISLTLDIGGIVFFANIVLLYSTIQAGFSNILGGPKDVTWLLPHQKLYYSRHAAADSLHTKAAGAVWWNHQVC
ncbi:hypothetical protein SGCOL_001282 [Colletotrichum sp. CLE4]